MRGSIYSHSPWKRMTSSTDRIWKWCYTTFKAGSSKATLLLLRSFEMLALWIFPSGTLLRNQLPCCGKPNLHGEDTRICCGQHSQKGPSLPSPGARNEHQEASRWFQPEVPNIVEHKQATSAILWPKPWHTKSMSIIKWFYATSSSLCSHK